MNVLEIVNELDSFHLGDLFSLQQAIGYAIEKKVKELKL